MFHHTVSWQEKRSFIAILCICCLLQFASEQLHHSSWVKCLVQGHLVSGFVVEVVHVLVCHCGWWWAAWDLLNECYKFPLFQLVQLLLAFKLANIENISSMNLLSFIDLLVNSEFISSTVINIVWYLMLLSPYLVGFTHLVEFLWSSTHRFCLSNWHNTWNRVLCL